MNRKLFNGWSKTYNMDIECLNETFPFGGYSAIKALIEKLEVHESKTYVLDLGIGTGVISSILYAKGANIYGIDFSEQMLNQCRLLMDKAILYNYDISLGIENLQLSYMFDYIISTYVFHHFDDVTKIKLIIGSIKKIKKTGSFIISDLCFPCRHDLEQYKKQNINKLDDGEIYFIVDEFIEKLRRYHLNYVYEQLNPFTGVFRFYI